MNTKRITESSNPVLAGSLPALKRASARAKMLAAQTGTRLIVAPKAASVVGPKDSKTIKQ
jgi:hypothetical protein